MSIIVPQQSLTKEMKHADKLFGWFIHVMIYVLLFSFSGMVLAIIKFVGSVNYPGWIKVPWMTMDILLTLVFIVIVGITCAIVQLDDEGNEGVMSFCVVVLIIAGVLIYKEMLGFVSIALFIIYSVLFVVGFVAFPISKRQISEEIIVQGIEEEPLDPSPLEPACSICKKVSQYIVCVECEYEHRREIQRVRSQNWRAKKAGEPSTLTIAEWLQILDTFQHHCAYCQTRPYELMEHYIPIGQGKSDGGTTATNCVPGCRVCNAGKSNKHPEHYSVNRSAKQLKLSEK